MGQRGCCLPNHQEYYWSYTTGSNRCIHVISRKYRLLLKSSVLQSVHCRACLYLCSGRSFWVWACARCFSAEICQHVCNGWQVQTSCLGWLCLDGKLCGTFPAGKGCISLFCWSMNVLCSRPLCKIACQTSYHKSTVLYLMPPGGHLFLQTPCSPSGTCYSSHMLAIMHTHHTLLSTLCTTVFTTTLTFTTHCVPYIGNLWHKVRVVIVAKFNKILNFKVSCNYNNYNFGTRNQCRMLWRTYWYIISLFILTTTWENNDFCIFQGQMTCQVKTMILWKNVICVTLNYLYLAHQNENDIKYQNEALCMFYTSV